MSCPAVTANVGYWATLSLNIPVRAAHGAEPGAERFHLVYCILLRMRERSWARHSSHRSQLVCAAGFPASSYHRVAIMHVHACANPNPNPSPRVCEQDFTRHAKSQQDQALGQAIGLPAFMALFSLLGGWIGVWRVGDCELCMCEQHPCQLECVTVRATPAKASRPPNRQRARAYTPHV
jgi:cytosine/uracil/thiamine/allantoin permease